MISRYNDTCQILYQQQTVGYISVVIIINKVIIGNKDTFTTCVIIFVHVSYSQGSLLYLLDLNVQANKYFFILNLTRIMKVSNLSSVNTLYNMEVRLYCHQISSN